MPEVLSKPIVKINISFTKEFFVPPTGKVLGLIERASLETGIATSTLSKIVWCESRYQETALNKNINGSNDFSIWQINSVHLPEAQKLGLDIINSAKDNTSMAIVLLKRYGVSPWVCA